MRLHSWTLVAALFLAIPAVAAPAPHKTLPIVNGDFEQGAHGWNIPADEGMSTLSQEQAASGKWSLKVVDDHPKNGSSATASRVPIEGVGVYELHGKALPVSGSGLGIYVRVLDKEGRLIGKGDDFHRGAPSEPVGKWVPFTSTIYAPEGAAYLELWIHSYSHAKVVAYLDDFRFEALDPKEMRPPWEGTYKIRPEEKAKLTAADVVGPDGIVYPDWRWAGIPGGIPKVPAVARIEEFGARANDDADDSAALERGAEEVGKRGGGALLLGAGTYYLDRPVVITRDGVVLRGAGAEKTRLVFRYGVPAGGVRFCRPAPGATVTPTTAIEIHADPKELQALSLEVDGQQVRRIQRHAHWGGTFSLSVAGSAVTARAGSGEHILKAVAEYPGGRKAEATLRVRTDASAKAGRIHMPPAAAIVFSGGAYASPRIKLARDGRRGDRELLLESTEGIAAGDRIRLRAPKTPRWDALVRNACQWGEYRRTELLVERVDGQRITVNQPLRIGFPVVDGAYAQEIQPIRRCGVEDLSLEQREPIWTSGIYFHNVWESWARGVAVKKAGRFPLYFTGAKWCEIRDCVLDDAWFKGGGGTAYAGWEQACDCLMENVTTYKLRHAPCVQWAASGNVIRKSAFYASDAQWHSGWTHENLYEECVIESTTDNGAYGYGMWASPPEDTAHGPNGPRNVVYNCDVRSPKAGLWMGGMNENWLILYNRFIAGSGPGILAKTASFDHIIRGNVFCLADEKRPAVVLLSPDCIGVELIGNRVLGGNGQLWGGLGKPLVERDNRLEPAGEAPRPRPAVPSIFEWQRQQR
ncbi:MAG TPA: right-handed parallel beta-helix repeat-containing protein [Armatimonadetes bacterium]|nr:right-handed parallel beta-helix repeat-containing protein [Armatimonadota bacterium]